jgi:hypothetical protein
MPATDYSVELYTLSLLCTPSFANTRLWENIKLATTNHLITNELFIDINTRSVKIFNVYSLLEQENLCLPCKPIMTIPYKNFIDAMKSWSQLYQQKASVVHLAWNNDTQTVYITLDKYSCFQPSWIHKIFTHLKMK